MKSNKHIVLIVPGFPENEQDSRCLPAVQHYVKELSSRTARVSVFALHYPYTKEQYVWKGVRIYPLNGGNSFFKRLFIVPKRLHKKFKELNDKHPVDCIHSFWLNEATVMGYHLAKKYDVPILGTAHGKDVLPENKYLTDLRGTDVRFFCLSDYQKTYLRNAGIFEVETTPWGLDTCPSNLPKTIDVITVANLIPLKNVDYVLELFAKYRELTPEFKAVIVGDGVQRREFEAFVREKNLTDNVQFTGIVSHEKATDLIAKSKVLVHAARFEGFGMTIIEALASGTHVLASNVGVAQENSDVNLLSMDLESDTETLAKLLDQKEPDPVVYSIKDTVTRYLEVYNGL